MCFNGRARPPGRPCHEPGEATPPRALVERPGFATVFPAIPEKTLHIFRNRRKNGGATWASATGSLGGSLPQSLTPSHPTWARDTTTERQHSSTPRLPVAEATVAARRLCGLCVHCVEIYFRQPLRKIRYVKSVLLRTKLRGTMAPCERKTHF